jgi:hypothetical protein
MAPRLLSSRSDTCLSPYLSPSRPRLCTRCCCRCCSWSSSQRGKKEQPLEVRFCALGASSSNSWRIWSSSGSAIYSNSLYPRLFSFVFFGWSFFVQGDCSSGAVGILVARFCRFVKESPGVSSAVDFLLTTA